MTILATAMILAAGRGTRMGALTTHSPKPLLAVRGKPLLQWHLEALARAGNAKAVINTAWQGAQISEKFTHEFLPVPPANQRLPLLISYSQEGQDFGYALETAGGIARALPLLDEVFWCAAGDVFAPEFEYAAEAMARFAASGLLAHLWLVPNPVQHPAGDFGLDEKGFVLNHAAQQFTFSGLALYRRRLFEPPWLAIPAGNPAGVVAPLATLLRLAIDRKQVSASVYAGAWADIGTPERLAQINTAKDTAGDTTSRV